MKNKNYYLATGALLCSTALGILAPIQNTYADTLTPEEDAVLTVMEGIENTVQPLLDGATPPTGYNYDFSIETYNTDGDEMVLNEDNWQYSPMYRPGTVPAYIHLNKSAVNYVKYAYTKDDSADLNNGIFEFAQSVTGAIVDYLRDNGFWLYQDSPTYLGGKEYINGTTGIVCSIQVNSMSGGGPSSNYYSSDYSCGHIDWWSMNDEWTAFVNSIGNAYYEKTGAYPRLPYSGYDYEQSDLPEVHNSTYSPYQWTDLAVGNAYGLFYRVSPESDWVFFTATQAVLDCSDFEGEAEKGFGGFVCYDTELGELSTVGAIKEELPKSPDTGSSTSESNGNVTTISTAIVAGTIVSLCSFFYLFKRQKQFGH